MAPSDRTRAEPHGRGDASARVRAQRFLVRWLPPGRVANAVRAALAAMAAWLAGNTLPGDIRDYAYAAALGAFIATGTTIFTIARTALQQAVGLAIGAALGLAMVALQLPALVEIGIIAAVGVALQGAAALGIGAGVVPVVALLVILFGGVDADGYAVGYVGQFTVGLLVGVLVNAIALPPLHDREAHRRIDAAVHDLADRADALAELLRGDWPPEDDAWSMWGAELEQRVADLEADVREAGESRRFNPRTLWREHDVEHDRAAVDALKAVVHRVIDLLDALAGAAWATPVKVNLDADERMKAADAVTALSAHLRAWARLEGVADASAASMEAIDALYEHVSAQPRPESGAGAVVFALRAIRARVDRAAGVEAAREA
ncbi:FUSC family protein [Agrococcus beijingensis]|uniref:FUSC family protein n=1 Tax=Agrococcus beijingensis TaxID=3068634 RepID=UPI0027425617|nr:hypothetical protein [Agrococcus sp. REN33]